jgi:glycine cleavage system protein P-like pyridoxal-binding family
MNLNKKIICKDGFSMSVQASKYNYCSPREDDAKRYHAVEVGFPNAKESLLIEYAENITKPELTVYAYVPAVVVSLVIAKHGGIISGELPKGIPYLKAGK